MPMSNTPGNYDARGIDPKTWKVPPFHYWSGYADVFGHDIRQSRATQAEVARDVGSWLQARDPRTNRLVWSVRQPGLYTGGTLTTKGGLVFAGQSTGWFVAYDARTGKALWRFNSQRPITAPPISYTIAGRQYVSLLVGAGGSVGAEGQMGDAAGRSGYRDGGRRLLTFALDGRARLADAPRESLTPLDVPGFRVDPKLALRGRQVFDTECFTCHGSGAISGGGSPNLLSSPTATDLPTIKRIALGGALELRGMPKFTELTDTDIDAVYHYLRQRARDELQKDRPTKR